MIIRKIVFISGVIFLCTPSGAKGPDGFIEPAPCKTAMRSPIKLDTNYTVLTPQLRATVKSYLANGSVSAMFSVRIQFNRLSAIESISSNKIGWDGKTGQVDTILSIGEISKLSTRPGITLILAVR